MGTVRHPYGETITIHPFVEDAGRDENGNPTSGFGPDIERQHCAVAPHVEEQASDPNRSQVIDGLDIYDSFDCPVGPRDEVTVRGDRYKVVKDIARWHNPFTGEEPGSVFTVKEVKG